MEIKRDYYLDKIISKKDNDMVKVITGIRRCGKTYLLFKLYYDYLNSKGIKNENIIRISLDDSSNEYLWKYDNFYKFLKSEISKRKERCYIFIDEIQLVRPKISEYTGEKLTFHFILIELMKQADIYVTGSNSKMLSSDIITEFRGRGTEIRIHPLSFKEIVDFNNDRSQINELFNNYLKFGGLPQVFLQNSLEEKINLLNNNFNLVYLKDIIERNDIRNDKGVIDDILKVLASSIGSFSNSLKIANTFKSKLKINISSRTVGNYLNIMANSFIISEVERSNVKGKKYIGSSSKFYFEDLGIRNSIINFKNFDEGHMLENIVYNELIRRGFLVNVGVIETFIKNEYNKNERVNYEIDFIAKKFDTKFYIQTTMFLGTREINERETRGLIKIKEPYKKIIIVKENVMPHYDENGIFIVDIINFLLDESILK